uniref:Protein Ycf2 n=1 Tax=Gastrodia longistyla TaxID=2861180 RepID=A0A8F7CF52_9ASPA|nr:hypothetical chloroplast RF21 [Gastrodia longistyla]QXU60602.1 hypothetical chloroplast RF21 [Gastrodia longistyla]UVG40921.1 hypothetical chloroplast RF21 [Gastrodia longistyla]
MIMKLNWIFELIETKNHRYLLNLWTNYNLVVFLTKILFQQEHFMKLFYFQNWSILFLSRDKNSSKYNGFISYLLFLFIIIILFHIKNKIIIEKKNIYLINILPINYNFIKSINNSLKEYYWSYNINNLKESLLHYLKNNEEEILLLTPIPIKKKNIYEFEFYRGSQWWRYWFVKKLTRIFLSCHLFQPNSILSEIFISLINKDKKDIEFIFCYYIDDLKYKNKEINFNLEKLLVILGNKSVCYIIYTFYKEALTINQDKSLGKLHKLYFKILSNIKDDSARSILMRIIISKQNEKDYKFIYDINNPFINFMNMNKDSKYSEYITFIYNTNINKLNDKLIIFKTSFIQKENKLDTFNLKKSYLYHILMEVFVFNIKRYIYLFLYNLYNIILDIYMGSKLLNNFYSNVESKEIGELFKIILYLIIIEKKFILFHPSDYFIKMNIMNKKKKIFDLVTRLKFIINEKIMMSYTLSYNIEYILFQLQKILDIFTIKDIKLRYLNLIGKDKEFQIEINKAISIVSIIKYTIKKNLSNFEKNKSKDNNNNNFFDPIIYQTNNTYSCKINNLFFEHNNILLRIVKYYYESLFLFLNKSLNYLFINISKIHIYRSKIHIYIYLIKKKKEEYKKEYYVQKEFNLSIRLHEQYNWLETSNSDIVSLKTYFFKINRFKLFKNKNNLWFYHNRVLLLKKKEPYINTYNYNFMYVNLLDSFILSGCKNIFSVSIGKNKYSFYLLNRNIRLPIKSKLIDIDILIDKYLSTSSFIYQLNNLYKYLHFTNITELLLHKYILSNRYIYETYLTKEQVFILEKNNIKSILDINISHLERYALYKYLIINRDSIMGLKYTYFFINKLPLPLFEHFKNQKEQDPILIYKSILKRIFYISRWDRLQAYMPCLLILTSWTYMKLIILDSIYDIFLSSIQNIKYIFYDTMNKLYGFIKFIIHELISNLQYIPINDTFNEILNNILLYKRYKINIKSYTASKNTSKLLCLIFIFIFTQLLFFYQSYCELQKEFEEIKFLIIPSYMMGLKRILSRYPIYKYNSFLVITEKFENYIFLKNFIKIKMWIKIIPNTINRIKFFKNTMLLSNISKYIFYLINKRYKIKKDWINDKIEIWVANNINIFDEEERKFLSQFLTLKEEKHLLNLLSDMDHEFISKNIFSFKINDQPGFISLHYLLDIHQIDINTYIFIFKRYILLERHILLSHFHKIRYSQIFCGFNRSNEKPFSLRLSLSYKGVLVIGSIGTGLSYFMKYITNKPLVPLITIFISKFWGYKQKTTKFKLFDYFDNNVNSVDNTDDIYIKNINMLDMSTASNLDQLGLILQFELAKEISPCIIWIPNIHYLQRSEFNYFYIGVGILDNYLFGDIERSYLGKIIVIASTQIPKKVDPVLIDTNRFNICINIRRLILSQQQKQFFIISYTRGFYFENKMFRANKNKINTGYFAMIDLITIINEVLSLSTTQNSSNIEMNIIISASHIRNWNYISKIISIKKNDLLLYQIGRAFINNVFIRNLLLDPISIYLNNKSCIRWNYFMYKWYLEFGTSIKKLTILFYIFNCFAGLVAKDIFYLYEGDNKIILYEFIDNEFYIVKGLLQLEGDESMYLPNFFGIERYFNNFYNNKITLFNRLKLIYCREWFDKNVYEEEILSLLQFENNDVHNIVWAPSIEQLCDKLYYFIIIGSEYFKYVSSEEYLKGLFFSQTKFPAYTSKCWFINIKKPIYNHRFIIINWFFYIYNTLILYEIYQYLLNIFLYNNILLYKLRKDLLRNKWIFSDEINNNIYNI